MEPAVPNDHPPLPPPRRLIPFSPVRREISGSGLVLGGIAGLPTLEGFQRQLEPELAAPVALPEQEAQRVVRRLLAITADHARAAQRMSVDFRLLDLSKILDWLREHAAGGSPKLELSGDEGLDYLRQALIDDLLLEPANILLATPTGTDSIRYDAMDSVSWRECLDLFENSFSLIR